MFQIPTESFQKFQQQCQQQLQECSKHLQQLQKTAHEVASDMATLQFETAKKISSQPHPYKDAKGSDFTAIANAQAKILTETGNILVKHTTETMSLLKKFGEEYAKCCKAAQTSK